MLNSSWTTLRTALLLAAGTFLMPACGGSAEFSAAQAGAAGNGSGGKGAGGSGSGGSANAGSGGDCRHSCPAIGCGPGFKSVNQPGECCPTCVPDGSGGTGGNCSDLGCIDIGCGEGFKSVQYPGDCCPTCVPDGSGGSGGHSPCENLNCPAIDCLQGYKLVTSPDNCCGTCVPDQDACLEGQTEYKTLRNKLLADPSALACLKNTDCVVLSTNASCGDQCAGYAVNAQAAVSIDQQLSQFAADNCSACPVIQAPCAAPPPPYCSGGQCMLYGYL